MADPGATTAAGDGLTIDSVKDYYGKVLSSTLDLKTSACTTAGKPAPYILEALKNVPEDVVAKYYGCGNPLPPGLNGKDVLDLGSGSGRDCYLASALVGSEGSVVGVDMTEEQLDTARAHNESYTTGTLGYAETNMSFVKGYIEDLAGAGIKPASFDVAISNCVVNLSPDKPAVIKGVYDALREGGELYFSDVYADRRVPESVRQHKVLWGECISGALYVEDFKRICHAVGFTDPRLLSASEIEIHDPTLKAVTGNIRFFSITYRCFKIASLETLCEDYGQVAYYKGTIPESPFKFVLDDHHVFERDRPLLVCGNSAAMVGESWLKEHFRIEGDHSTHFGLFPGCGGIQVTASAGGSGDCADGACC